MDKYQKLVDEWAQTLEEPYWPPLSILARITEEVGELARLINHIYGSKPKKPEEAEQELGEEIADIIFALICMANVHNIDLDKEIIKVVDKSKIRDKDRFKKK
jgi:NTP pyrophosphatase (non-canonical NTP hydrolase)